MGQLEGELSNISAGLEGLRGEVHGTLGELRNEIGSLTEQLAAILTQVWSQNSAILWTHRVSAATTRNDPRVIGRRARFSRRAWARKRGRPRRSAGQQASTWPRTPRRG
jgi:hypothetical protein